MSRLGRCEYVSSMRQPCLTHYLNEQLSAVSTVEAAVTLARLTAVTPSGASIDSVFGENTSWHPVRSIPNQNHMAHSEATVTQRGTVDVTASAWICGLASLIDKVRALEGTPVSLEFSARKHTTVSMLLLHRLGLLGVLHPTGSSGEPYVLPVTIAKMSSM